MELDFFMTLRYSHSQTTQDATDTSVTVRARQPNTYTPMTRAGMRAMITSSMMERVSSLVRIWGEEDAISFKLL